MYGYGGRITCAIVQAQEPARRKRSKPPAKSEKRVRVVKPAPEPPAPAPAEQDDEMIHCAYCGPQRGVDMGDGWKRCASCGTL